MIIKFLQSPDHDRDRIALPGLIGERELEYCATPGFIETSLLQESSLIFAAQLNERDYELARRVIPELRAFQDYDDWLDFRNGSFWGLEMAGFKVEIVPVSLSAFETWLRTTPTPPRISALDRFAGVYALRAAHRQFEEASF
jgi:hypothetical protein